MYTINIIQRNMAVAKKQWVRLSVIYSKVIDGMRFMLKLN